MSLLEFEEGECGCTAINGKIDDYNLDFLERKYAGTGVFFENDTLENEATVSWSSSADAALILNAKVDFLNFVVPV